MAGAGDSARLAVEGRLEHLAEAFHIEGLRHVIERSVSQARPSSVLAVTMTIGTSGRSRRSWSSVCVPLASGRFISRGVAAGRSAFVNVTTRWDRERFSLRPERAE